MGRKLALIIGNSRYDDPGLARLTTAAVDVRDLAGVLRAPDIGQFDEVVELPDEGLAAVRRSIAQFFSQATKDDLLVFYFSGHGVKDENGHLYLAVRDTEVRLLAGTSIEAAFITAQMDRSYSKRQVLILDCCHSGAFAYGTKAAEAQVVGTAPAFEGTGYGRVVLTATDSTQYAWQGDQIIGESENSVFTHYLLAGLKTGEADRDGDGLITIDELYDYVYGHVVSETPKQTPGKWSYKQEGDIVVARNPRPFAPAAGLPLEVRALVESPLARLRTEAIPELASLLQGRHRGLALAARRVLESLRADDSRKVSAAAETVLETLAQQEAAAAAAAAEAERVRQEAERLVAEAAGRLALQDLAGALTQVDAARELDPSRTETMALRDEIRHAIEEAHQKEEQHDRLAADVVERARRDFAAGGYDAAVAALSRFHPPHPLVSCALADHTAELERLRRQEDERKRNEAERLARRQEVVDLLNAAHIDIQREAFIEALSALRRVRQLDPDVAGLTELTEAAEAGRAAAEDAARRRHQSESRLAAALKRYRKRDFGRALALAEEACRLDPENSAVSGMRDEIRQARDGRAADSSSSGSAWPTRLSGHMFLPFLRRSRPLQMGLVAIVLAAGLIVVLFSLPRREAMPSRKPEGGSEPAPPMRDTPLVLTPITPSVPPETAPSFVPLAVPPLSKPPAGEVAAQPPPQADQKRKPSGLQAPAPSAAAPSNVEARIATLLADGDRLMEARNYDGARSAYEEAGRLGSVVGRERAEKAGQEKERGAQVRLTLSRAEKLQDTGDYGEALRAIDEALAIDPKSAEAKRLRQRVIQAQRFEDEALRPGRE